MAIVLGFMHLLDVVFFVGLAGSSIVVIYSFIEDTIELFAKDELPAAQGAPTTGTSGSGMPTRS